MVLLLVVSACGDDGTAIAEFTDTTVESAHQDPALTDETEPPEGREANGTPPEAQLPDLIGQNIEVAGVWTGGEQEYFETVLAEFERLTGAQVTFTFMGDDIAAVLGARVQSGNAPDVALLPQPSLMNQLVEQGVLVPIDQLVRDSMQQYYAPLWADIGSVEGTQYGLVWKAGNKSTVWYNTAIFNEAGVELPQTWDDLISSARTILDAGITPFSIAGADGWTLTDWFENVYLQTAGPEMYDQLTNREIPWTHESVRTALARLAQVFQNDLVVGGNSGALQVNFPQSVTQVFGKPPQAAIVYEGEFLAVVITSETDAQLQTDADYFTFPSIDGAPASVVVGGDTATAVLVTDSEGGRALLQFLAMPESAQIWVERGGFTSPNQGVPAEAYPEPILAQVADDLARGEVVRFDLSDQAPAAFGGTPGQGMWRLLQDFLANPNQIDSIMQQLENAAAQAYGG